MASELQEIREGITGILQGWAANTLAHWHVRLELDIPVGQILSYLAKRGVSIQTPNGMMTLSDLLKEEVKNGKMSA